MIRRPGLKVKQRDEQSGLAGIFRVSGRKTGKSGLVDGL